MGRLTYYPGCSLRHSAAEFDVSTRLVLRKLGVEFIEVPDWTCCGSSPAHMTDHLLAQGLAARNLRQAATVGDEMFAPCPSCYQRQKDAELEIEEDPEFRQKLNEVLDLPYEGSVRVLTLSEVLLRKGGLKAIRSNVTTDLVKLKVVPYYGCLLGRPSRLTGEADEEQPTSMDRLLEAAGATVQWWNYKTECCGASVGMPKAVIHRRLSRKILDQALQAGADAVVVACPLCHQNLDMRQGQINSAFGASYSMPILYVTQVLGLAFGHSAEELLLQKHAVDPRPVVAKAIKEAVAFRQEEARMAAEHEAREKVKEAARQDKARRRAGKAASSSEGEAARGETAPVASADGGEEEAAG